MLVFPKMEAGVYERMHNYDLHGKSKLLLFVSQGQKYLFCPLNNLTAIIFSIPPLERRWVAKLKTRHWVRGSTAFSANKKCPTITVSEICSQQPRYSVDFPTNRSCCRFLHLFLWGSLFTLQITCCCRSTKCW